MKKITLEFLRSLKLDSNFKLLEFKSDMFLTPLEFIDQFKDRVHSNADIINVLCRKEFMTDKDLRLFAIWCAREAYCQIRNPDIKSIQACSIAEMFANDEETEEELNIAYKESWDVIANIISDDEIDWDIVRVYYAASNTCVSDIQTIWGNAEMWAVSENISREQQIEQLKSYFVPGNIPGKQEFDKNGWMDKEDRRIIEEIRANENAGPEITIEDPVEEKPTGRIEPEF